MNGPSDKLELVRFRENEMSGRGPLIALALFTAIAAPMPLYVLFGIFADSYDKWMHPRGTTYPMPNLAPLYFFGCLLILCPIAALWFFYFSAKKKRKT